MIASPAPRQGIFTRAWVRLFGSKDAIERQLDATAKEGATLARLAHACAFLMVILFSLGSLVALAGDAVGQIAAGHVTIPAVIAIGVSTLLVACGDVAMLYSASTIRLLRQRRAEGAAVHVVVLAGVALLEAGTYLYMSARYEAPANGAQWALIVARSVAAPLLSVYLSLARPLPVTARDMLALAERIAGEGVLRDLGILAADPFASLADKVALYLAAAVLTDSDRTRLDALLDVAKQRAMVMGSNVPLDTAEKPTRPPTGGGSPMSASRRARPASAASDTHRLLALPAPQEDRPAAVNVAASKPSAEERIYTYLATHPRASVRTIERRCGVSGSTASKHRALWLQDRAGKAAQ